MKESGLKPLDDGKSNDKPIHVFGSNLESRVVTGDIEDSQPISFGTFQEVRKEDDIDIIRKRKFDAITGEEDEETVFQGDFKLFAWNLDTSNWDERGRGQLKLNDSQETDKCQSRIIMRVGGTLKLVLNVAIRHNSFKVLANSKTSIRFTDSQTVWAASGSNAGQLRELIDQRLQRVAEQEDEINQKKPKTENEVNYELNVSKRDKSKTEEKLGERLEKKSAKIQEEREDEASEKVTKNHDDHDEVEVPKDENKEGLRQEVNKMRDGSEQEGRLESEEPDTARSDLHPTSEEVSEDTCSIEKKETEKADLEGEETLEKNSDEVNL